MRARGQRSAARHGRSRGGPRPPTRRPPARPRRAHLGRQRGLPLGHLEVATDLGRRSGSGGGRGRARVGPSSSVGAPAGAAGEGAAATQAWAHPRRGKALVQVVDEAAAAPGARHPGRGNAPPAGRAASAAAAALRARGRRRRRRRRRRGERFCRLCLRKWGPIPRAPASGRGPTGAACAGSRSAGSDTGPDRVLRVTQGSGRCAVFAGNG
jgi:hypothetical protein